MKHRFNLEVIVETDEDTTGAIAALELLRECGEYLETDNVTFVSLNRYDEKDDD